jgi:hypothetical protein
LSCYWWLPMSKKSLASRRNRGMQGKEYLE